MVMSPEAEPHQRPYAAPANVKTVLDRVRSRNLPDSIDLDFLRIAGIPEGALTRVVAALRFLRLIDGNGRPTDLLRALAGAPTEEYRDLLAGAVRDAYSEDFRRVDPSQDTQATIIDAFRTYVPRSQTSRMVMMFLGLCREAGIPVAEAPRERKMQTGPKRRIALSGRSGGSATANGQLTVTPKPLSTPEGAIFGLLSQDDVAAMSEEQSKAVWHALGIAYGTISRARAKAEAAERATRNAAAAEPEEAPAE